MERNQILLIGGACVVVGFIGLQILSGHHDDEGMPLAHSRRAGDKQSADGERSDGGYEGRYASNGRSGGGSASDHGRGSNAGIGSRYGDAGGSRRDPNSRAAQTLLAGRTNRGGTVGAGGSAGGTGSSGSGVFDRGGSRQLEGSAPGRSDVVEFLASQPASGRSASGDKDGNEGDVALELKRPEDADSAGVKKDIQTPDSNEDGLTFTEGSKLAFPDGGNVNGEAGTISFQIEPNWNGNDETNNSLVTLRSENGWSNRLELVKNGRYLRFILADNVGREADISVPIDAWTPGEAHDVRATWGDQKTALFIDGAKVGENTYTEFVRPDAPLYVGSDHNGSTYSGANSTLRNFKVMNSANFSG